MMSTSSKNYLKDLLIDEDLNNQTVTSEELSIIFNFECFGDDVTVCFCTAKFPNQYVEYGVGKAYRNVRLAKYISICEVLEHYSFFFGVSDCEPLRLTIDDLGKEPFLSLNSPRWQWIASRDDELFLTCDEFRGLSNQSLTALFPRALYNPIYVPKTAAERRGVYGTQINAYRTNSGTSCAPTIDDALLHGIFELVERDSLGLALLKHVFSANPKDIAVLEIDKDNRFIWDLAKSIERETERIIKVFDITSDLNIPTFLVGLYPSTLLSPISFGSAADINPDVALVRAMLESVQVYYADLKYPEEKPVASFDLTSNLYNGFLDGGVFNYRGAERTSTFSQWKSQRVQFSSQLGDVLASVVSGLSIGGIHTYWRSLQCPFDDLVVTAVIAPQLEKFHLVARGRRVEPGERGGVWLDGSEMNI